MLENVGIRILVAVIVIALGFMVLKFITPPDKEQATLEYAAPVHQSKRGVRSILKKNKNTPSPHMADDYPQYAPSPVDATMILGGDFGTNRNADTAIMNSVDKTMGTSDYPLALPSVSMVDGYQYEDSFGAEL
jgi:hypothetical protein